MTNQYLFTSESVSEGHPDKVADQISDAVLDAILRDDPTGRVACETLVKTGVVIVAGEVTTSAWIDLEKLVRETVLRIGYNHSDMGFDGASCGVINIIGKQSPDIAMGVDRSDKRKQGAGDQGLMFGYATDETDVLMPAPITLAHRLVKRQSEVRRRGKLSWLRPDAKSQVTLRYENDRPVGIEAVVLSTQHSDDISTSKLREAVMEEIIKPVLPKKWLDRRTRYHINPTGRFVVGGPVGDCGVTGRKIIVDTYGGFARHGGGAFSGKDPSKVDRSAAYAARYVAKNIVAAGLRHRRRRADLDHGGVLRHQRALARGAHGPGSPQLRSDALWPARDARPGASDLPEDRRLRTFRPRGTRVHLGTHRQGRGAGCRRPATRPQPRGLIGLTLPRTAAAW